ncbi:MAG: cysteine desulfurase [Flavobacteriaceae bacterium]|nr:cysteine desulfurase [Flavobacteriaceae bacterium]
MQTFYFDNAATTLINKEVIDIITKTMKDIYGNPSSTHQFGRKSKALVEESRKNIAKILNCTATEIVFTSGGSEADNLILRNAITNLGVERIVTSKIEHHAVLHTVKALKEEFSIKVDYVSLNEYGEVDYADLNSILQKSEEKVLVSLMLVNNEIGNILNVDKVCVICKDNNALFHSDAVQGITHLSIDLQKTPIDFIAVSAHKFHGPKGVGFAYFKKGFGIKPLLIGGEQERGARAGTENVHNIVGMEKALAIGIDNFYKDEKYISNLKQYFINQMKIHFPDIKFNGNSSHQEKSIFHIINVRFVKGYPMLLFHLDLKGVAASGSSACQSGSNNGSHVLNAILSEENALKTSIRFSFSRYNTKEEIDYLIDVLKVIIK